MEKNSLYSWSIEQKEEFEKKQEELFEKVRHYYIYTSFIDNNFDMFARKRNILMKLIEKAILSEDIDEDVQMKSRIKSSRSVYENKIINKNLDDIFAVTIAVRTQRELDYIYNMLSSQNNIKIIREKVLKKEKFVAEHIYIQIGNDPNLIECRLQTLREYENSYSHLLYKINGDNDFTQEEIEKIERIKQEQYDSGSVEIFGDIPCIWKASYNKETGKMYEVQLSTNEILKELYPFLKLKEERMEREV